MRSAIFVKNLYAFLRLVSPVVITLILLFLTDSCQSPPQKAWRQVYRGLNKSDQSFADSLIDYALNHEALYTICDSIKPMSSIKMFRLPVFSENRQQRDSALSALHLLHKRVSRFNQYQDLWQFILNPFERRDSIFKNVELYIIRQSRVQTIIRQYAAFYGKLGIAEQTPAATILAVTEYEHPYNRWRSYGYLFGYPEYAVDFFVQAGKQQDSSGVFVKRDFFQIPVQASATGYFTWAVPRGYQPTQADSLIWHQASRTLAKYRQLREPDQQFRKFTIQKVVRKMTKKI